jgi:transposase
MKIEFTPGHRRETIKVLERVIDDAEIIIGDKAYDAEFFRQELEEKGQKCVVPPKSNRKEQLEFDKELYKKRHVVENFFGKIKRFRRIATRYDKTIVSYASFVFLASSILWL